MANRHLQYKYALCRFFRSRGYEIDTDKKTIKIDVDDLNYKEQQRLKQLQNWGFTVINPTAQPVRHSSFRPNYIIADDYDPDESFIDFADEVMLKMKYGLYD